MAETRERHFFSAGGAPLAYSMPERTPRLYSFLEVVDSLGSPHRSSAQPRRRSGTAVSDCNSFSLTGIGNLAIRMENENREVW